MCRKCAMDDLSVLAAPAVQGALRTLDLLQASTRWLHIVVDFILNPSTGVFRFNCVAAHTSTRSKRRRGRRVVRAVSSTGLSAHTEHVDAPPLLDADWTVSAVCEAAV